MKKFLKILGRIFSVILIIVLLFTTVAFIYNRVQLKKEEAIWQNPPGQYVEVDGHKMHIYTEGEGDHTIVLMSGWGDTSPYVNFLPLCKDLSTDAKVVIIERFGYGLSDVVKEERTFDKIVENDRECLSKAGIEGPFVLCPHSIAGVEATLWAQKYPTEVEGIVGMDISIPGLDDQYKAESDAAKKQFPIMKCLIDTGIMRVLSGNPGDADELKIMEAAISNRNDINKCKLNENAHLIEALHEISNNPLPTAPTIQYISSQTTELTPGWLEGHQALVDASSNGKLVKLDCTHYVYKFEEERIVKDIKKFLKTL